MIRPADMDDSPILAVKATLKIDRFIRANYSARADADLRQIKNGRSKTR